MRDYATEPTPRPDWEDPAISEMMRDNAERRLRQRMQWAAQEAARLRKPLSKELLRIEKLRAEGKTSAEIAKMLGFYGPRGAGLIERRYFAEIDEKRAFQAAHPDLHK